MYMWLDVEKLTKLTNFVFQEKINIEVAVAFLCYIIAMQGLLYK